LCALLTNPVVRGGERSVTTGQLMPNRNVGSVMYLRGRCVGWANEGSEGLTLGAV